jgi:hypothetical protein
MRPSTSTFAAEIIRMMVHRRQQKKITSWLNSRELGTRPIARLLRTHQPVRLSLANHQRIQSPSNHPPGGIVDDVKRTVTDVTPMTAGRVTMLPRLGTETPPAPSQSVASIHSLEVLKCSVRLLYLTMSTPWMV